MRARHGVVLDDSACDHCAEPLAHVAFVETSCRRNPTRRRRFQRGQRIEQAGTMAHAEH
jgi:hypothetical protein